MSNYQRTEDLGAGLNQILMKRKPVASEVNRVGLPLAIGANYAELTGFTTSEGARLSSDGSWDLGIEDHVGPPLPVRPTKTYLTGSTLTVTSIEVEDLPESDTPTISRAAKVWEETKYHAGGLIHHPSESTKHFSVLRHANGIVYYQGPETSVTVSIFADRPLPADRKIWLQQRGWTGNTGMAARNLFGANGGWLDVTPSVEATAEQLPKTYERAWQRDIQKFLRKEGAKRSHALRETCIVRIPCEAEDGYFRIVLCGDGKPKNMLCVSPVFRVFSLSSSPSSIKGASMQTLPIEVGIKIFSAVANNAMTTAIHPATAAVQRAIGLAMPNFWAREASSAAYRATGLLDKVRSVYDTSQSIRDASCYQVDGVDGMVYEALDYAPLVGSNEGPQSPFPIEISSVIVPGTGANTSQANGTPTSNLKYVREDIVSSLQGLYFGWARITPSKALARQLNGQPNGFSSWWHPSIIVISVIHGAAFSVSYGTKKSVAAYLIHDFDNLNMTGSKIEVMIMGPLRKCDPASKLTERTDGEIKQKSEDRIADIAITQASLARPTWSVEAMYDRKKWETAEESIEGGKPKKLTKDMKDRYVDAAKAAQRQLDRIPAHRAGLRRRVDNSKEKGLGAGGIYVRR